MKLIYVIIVLIAQLKPAYLQSCKSSKKIDLVDLVVQSPIVVVILPNIDKANSKEQNATGTVTDVYHSRHGNFTVGSSVSFGPIGKTKHCTTIKDNKSKYVVFLQNPLSINFYWITYNPIKASPKRLRKLSKILCKNCLVPPSFKRTFQMYKRKEETKLKIKCKASGKPLPTLTWYHGKTVLTNATALKGVVLKNRKKGGSGSILIKKVDREYHNTTFTCQANNPVSQYGVNFTALVNITHYLSDEKCHKYCSKEDESFCIKGVCCVETDSRLRCNCYDGWTGVRCNQKDYFTSPVISSPEQRHMQRLVAVLGMCLALMVVLFICLSVYCYFKRSRSDMLYQMVKSRSKSVAVTRSHLGESDNSHTNANDSLLTGSGTAVNRANASIETQGISNVSHTEADNSRFKANHVLLDKKTSASTINGGSKRDRLNGLAKIAISQQSSLRHLASPKNSSPVIGSGRLQMQHDAGSTHDFGHLQSHNQGRDMPSLPLNSAVLNIIEHHSNASSVADSPDLHIKSKSKLDNGTKVFANNLDLSGDSSKNHNMSTFGPNGDIQEESLSREEGVLSSVTSHSSMSSPTNGFPLHSPTSLREGDFFTSHSPQSVSPKLISNTNSTNKHSFHPKDDPTFLSGHSDHEDMFVGVEIPDMSLGLCPSTPDHDSSNKLPRQNAIDPQGFHYSTPVVQLRPESSGVSSAQLQQLPLLSKPSLPFKKGGDASESAASLSSNMSAVADSYYDSDTPRIHV